MIFVAMGYANARQVLNYQHYGFWLGDALAGFTPFFIGIFSTTKEIGKNRKVSFETFYFLEIKVLLL